MTWDDDLPDGDLPDEERRGIDPHWLALQRRSPLPAYMPDSVPGGVQAPWRRVVALVLLVILVGATAAGVCLTYLPGNLLGFSD